MLRWCARVQRGQQVATQPSRTRNPFDDDDPPPAPVRSLMQTFFHSDACWIIWNICRSCAQIRDYYWCFKCLLLHRLGD